MRPNQWWLCTASSLGPSMFTRFNVYGIGVYCLLESEESNVFSFPFDRLKFQGDGFPEFYYELHSCTTPLISQSKIIHRLGPDSPCCCRSSYQSTRIIWTGY